jgi:hypothetical protein
MGGSSKQAQPQIIQQRAPDMSPLYAMQAAQGEQMAQALRNKNELLGYAAKSIPQIAMPDISGQNKRILDQSIINAYQGRETEKMLDPAAYAMRQQISPLVQNLTSPEATAARQNQWLKTSGLDRVFGTGAGLSTFGASGLADASTEQGFQNMLRNLQIQQGMLGQAPSVGVNPSSAASQVEAAKAQQAQLQNAFTQNILGQGSGLVDQAFLGGQNLYNSGMQLASQDIQNQAAVNAANANAQAAIRGAQLGSRRDMWGNIASNAASGAMTGLATGNPYGVAAGAIIGGGLGAMY